MVYLGAVGKEFEAGWDGIIHPRVKIMGGTSFLRRVSLHGFRGSSSNQKLDEPKRELDDQIPDTAPITPETQTVLLLHGARQPYQLTENHPVPSLDRKSVV